MAKRKGRGGRSKSIKNRATFEALKRKGYSVKKAAQISNGVLHNGVKKGKHHRK